MGTPEQLYNQTTEGIQIIVRPTYVPERSRPLENFFFYAYTIQITNHRNVDCQLKRRFWAIRNSSKKEEKITGKGVVGETPIIKKGESYTYTSFCPLPGPFGNMRGHYEFIECESGENFKAEVPVFFLRPPESFENQSIQ